MNTQVKTAVFIMFGIIGLLTAAYIYGISTQWDEMTARPVRVSYFISDLTVLFPLGLIGGIGIMRGSRRAHFLFILSLGVLLFDTAHQVYYLFWENYFGVPLWSAALLLAGVAAYTFFAYRAVISNVEGMKQ